MYKPHKIILSLSGLITLIAGSLYDFQMSETLVASLLTMLSIFFGFYITSASLLLSGNAIKTLHKAEDKRKDRLLSHTIRDYYQFGLYSLLVNIGALILVLLFYPNDDTSYDTAVSLNTFDLEVFSNSIALSLTVINTIFAFMKVRLFMTLFMQEVYTKTD